MLRHHHDLEVASFVIPELGLPHLSPGGVGCSLAATDLRHRLEPAEAIAEVVDLAGNTSAVDQSPLALIVVPLSASPSNTAPALAPGALL